MRSAMQAAYESYFKKLDSLYDAVWGTKPTVPYSGDCDPSLFVGAPDEDGEIPWMPKLQPVPCGWCPVETKLGFSLRQELKDYYNTYFFLSLAAPLEAVSCISTGSTAPGRWRNWWRGSMRTPNTSSRGASGS